MNSWLCLVLCVVFFFVKGALWFHFVNCKEISPAIRPKRSKTHLRSEQDSMVDMPKIRRFIVCKEVEEGLCQIEMDIAGYRCRNLLEKSPEGKSTRQKMEVAKVRMKSANECFKDTGAFPANCTSGSCRCKPGLHYHAEKKLCFIACTKYGNDTIGYADMSIAGYNMESIYGTTRQVCTDACLKSETFICQTFDFGGLFSACFLSTSTYYTVPFEKRETDIGWVLGTRNCIG